MRPPSVVVLVLLLATTRPGAASAGPPAVPSPAPPVRRSFTLVHPQARGPALTETREAAVGEPIRTAPRVQWDDPWVWTETRPASDLLPDYVYQGEARLLVTTASTTVRERHDDGTVTPETFAATLVNGKVTGLDLSNVSTGVALAALRRHRATVQAVSLQDDSDANTRELLEELDRVAAPRLAVRLLWTLRPYSYRRIDLSALEILGSRLHALVVSGWFTRAGSLAKLTALRTLILDHDEAGKVVPHLASTRGLVELHLPEGRVPDGDLTTLGRLGSLRVLVLGEHAGRRLAPLASLRVLHTLVLRRTTADPTALASLRQVPLTRLVIGGDAVTDAGLDGLAGHPTLIELGVAGTQATRLDVVRRVPALTRLRLAGVRLSAAGLASIGRAARLEALTLKDCLFEESSLSGLGGGAPLRRLVLSGSRMTDAATPHLASLVGLIELDLANNQVTDAGVAPLARLRSLEVLELRGNPLTTRSLRSLAPLRRLRRLLLPAGVPAAARRAFARAHRGCVVP